MITKALIISVIIILIAWDIFAYSLGNSTESTVLRDWSWDWTLLPFVAGFLLTHWFFPRSKTSKTGWMYAIPIFIVLLSFDLIWHKYGIDPRPWFRYPGVYAFLGLPAGYFLWPQANY